MYDYSDTKVNLILSICLNHNNSVKNIYEKVIKTFDSKNDAKEFVYEQLNCYYHAGYEDIIDFINIPKENYLSDSILDPRFNTEAGTIVLFECMSFGANEGILISIFVTVMVIINYEIGDYKSMCYKMIDDTCNKIKIGTNNNINKNNNSKNTFLTIILTISIIFLALIITACIVE